MVLCSEVVTTPPNKPLLLAGGLKPRVLLQRDLAWRLIAAPFPGSLPS